jgi:hypothetical protein
MLTVNMNQAITKLNRLIEDGRQNAGRVIEHVMTQQPQDFIVKANALQFSGNDGLSVALNNAEFGVHRFALGQIAETANLPVKFLDSLTASEWGRCLAAHNQSEVFKHRDAKRRRAPHLVRQLGRVRGNHAADPPWPQARQEHHLLAENLSAGHQDDCLGAGGHHRDKGL